jgi:hypothetical protein
VPLPGQAIFYPVFSPEGFAIFMIE